MSAKVHRVEARRDETGHFIYPQYGESRCDPMEIMELCVDTAGGIVSLRALSE